MALSPAEKSRRYRERKAATVTSATATDTGDIPFNSVTTATGVTATVTSEQLQNATVTVTDTVTKFAQQHRRWIADMTDRIAVMENLMLELAQSHNQLRAELRDLVARNQDGVTATVTATKPPKGPSNLDRDPPGKPFFRDSALRNNPFPTPPLDNPHGKDPFKGDR